MKTLRFTILAVLILLGTNTFAQKTARKAEKFGNTLNLGVGIGYYGYVGHPIPVIHANFEFNVVRNFTLAPFITYYSYQKNNYWGNPHYPYRNYYYRETVVPIGVKGSYYFDQLLQASSKWDFYAAGSAGFAIRSTTWENGYNGDREIHRGPGNLYLDLHVGAEYHLNKKAGLFLDLSTGVSTFGLAVHF